MPVCLFATSPRPRRACPVQARGQGGVVLVIALIFMAVMSVLAVTSLRNAASSENVLGNVRTTELAAQAAEVALRHCEASVLHILTVKAGGASAYVSTFKPTNILQVSSPPQWQSITTWDSTSDAVFVLPLDLVNQVGMVNQAGQASITYKRPPECMVEPVPVLLNGTTELSNTSSFVVTARGFGPEVAAANDSRSHPLGSEVWLQSHIQFQ